MPLLSDYPQLKIIQDIAKKKKKVKKRKRRMKKTNVEIPLEIKGELKSAIEGFIEMRDMIKAPLTQRAMDSIIRSVRKLSNGSTKKAIEKLD